MCCCAVVFLAVLSWLALVFSGPGDSKYFVGWCTTMLSAGLGASINFGTFWGPCVMCCAIGGFVVLRHACDVCDVIEVGV